MSKLIDLNGAHALGKDSFHDEVVAGLEKLRLRLLNLSNRNRLLNFPTKPSKQFLRVVDAIADVIFQKLVSDSEELVFAPVPKPTQASGAMMLFDDFANDPETYLEGGNDAQVATVASSGRRMKADEHAR